MGNKVPKTEAIQVPRAIDDGSGETHTKGRRVLTVIRHDGTKLVFERGMSVSKLLKDFPGHGVYRASEELEYLGRARALSPNTSLKRGNTYLLLPQTQKQTQKKPLQQGMKGRWSKVNPVLSAFDSDSDEEEFLKEAEALPPPHTIKAAQEIGALTVAVRPTSGMKLFNYPHGQLASEQKILLTAGSLTKRTWFPKLPSILEVPTQ
ncbi:hypothetical protein R1sor_017363 [Riccia sorocarpa]|uniref:Uncharacterized protein n=1 Tax=Riccia sorocarpa TaxID=122646 RepID=A0ABD3IAM8_9MARC